MKLMSRKLVIDETTFAPMVELTIQVELVFINEESYLLTQEELYMKFGKMFLDNCIFLKSYEI